MNPADHTEPSQTETIAFSFDLSHAPEKVWRSLTDPALLSQWLLPVSDFALEPGAAFTFTIPPQPGWGGLVHCRLVEIDPLRKLRYTWAADPSLDTTVTFTLTPTPSGTHVLLVQTGFKPDQKRNFGGARYGWRMMGGRLINLLGTLS